MSGAPAGTPAAAEAVSRLGNEFFALVAELVGGSDGPRHGVLLMCGAHGIGGLRLSGHLDKDMWRVGVEQLVRMQIEAIGAERS